MPKTASVRPVKEGHISSSPLSTESSHLPHNFEKGSAVKEGRRCSHPSIGSARWPRGRLSLSGYPQTLLMDLDEGSGDGLKPPLTCIPQGKRFAVAVLKSQPSVHAPARGLPPLFTLGHRPLNINTYCYTYFSLTALTSSSTFSSRSVLNPRHESALEEAMRWDLLAVAAAALNAPGANALLRFSCSQLVVERLDP